MLPTKCVVPGNLKPSVILKYVQFRVKDKIYKFRRLIKADAKNNRYMATPVNCKLIHVNERMPPAEDMNYVTSTYKWAASVLCSDPHDPNGIWIKSNTRL